MKTLTARLVSKKLQFAAPLSVALIGVATYASAADATHGDCSQLAALAIKDVQITTVNAVAASSVGIKVAHCKVDGKIDQDINFSLLLPDQWNGKFMMGGGGGFVGSVQNQAVISINSGYATVGTDTGHQASGTEAGWARNHPERIANFGHRAVHRTSEVAKEILRRYYQTAASRSYFIGCSNGGRQALMSAQRYPDDFDGIVAGAPAANFMGIGAQFIKDQQVLFPNSNKLDAPLFPPALLKFVEQSILEKCDAIDGVKDGLMEDPRQCKFDLATLPACKDDQPGDQCVTSQQRHALQVVYGETRNKSGIIFQGQPFGGEGEAAGWAAWVAGVNPAMLNAQHAPNLRFAFGTEMFKNFVFADPNWDYSKYDLSTWQKDTASVSREVNATDPNLDAFKKRGGKLVLWHGWSDGGLSALGTVKYFDDVAARDAKSRDYLRMFMLPGVLHCGGGPGPDTVDWATVISDWVEKGQAPVRVVAQKTVAGSVTRSRPLCAYPQHATYTGKGSIDEEKNFECR